MTDEPKKKIIIDEDWKSQVEVEREAAKRQGEMPPSETPEAGEAAQGGAMPWPEPSLALMVTTLATQAMAAMGLLAYPDGGQTKVDLAQAKHFIDTIGVLQNKTRGNCAAEETELFESILHELRMAYVAVQERQIS
ncbi:MAG TPA: DUF1844 domain-containing protein [Thermoguttaceae bacterium]|nr:DUF1844 domain-containing protein [Thermoguttaceae bacterium]